MATLEPLGEAPGAQDMRGAQGASTLQSAGPRGARRGYHPGQGAKKSRVLGFGLWGALGF